jgi:hypothetical protein
VHGLGSSIDEMDQRELLTRIRRGDVAAAGIDSAILPGSYDKDESELDLVFGENDFDGDDHDLATFA